MPKTCTDAGFKDDVQIHGMVNGIDAERDKHSDTSVRVVPVKRRWVVEQTEPPHFDGASSSYFDGHGEDLNDPH